MKNIAYDYVEYYVGMAKMVAYWHVQALGFEVKAFCGPSTGVSDKVSYLLQKKEIKLLITSAATPNNYPIVSFVDRHGNGVKSVSIKVNDIEETYAYLMDAGVILLSGIVSKEDEQGVIRSVEVKLFDDNVVIFSDYSRYTGAYLPGYQALQVDWGTPKSNSQLLSIDHVACALRKNESVIWEPYLNRIFDSDTVFELKKENKNQLGMGMKVLQNTERSINNVLVEPNNEQHASQVKVFIDGHHGNGIQHIAFESEDIFATVKALKAGGTELIEFPEVYYQKLKEKYPELNDQEIEKLRSSNVLCEVKGEAILLQTFTLSIGDRPTFFYEIIQRINNYNGFGINNIKMLFEAVEEAITR